MLKEKIVMYSILLVRLFGGEITYSGEVSSQLKKIHLGLKAHYTHFHYPSVFYGEDKNQNRRSRKNIS